MYQHDLSHERLWFLSFLLTLTGSNIMCRYIKESFVHYFTMWNFGSILFWKQAKNLDRRSCSRPARKLGNNIEDFLGYLRKSKLNKNFKRSIFHTYKISGRKNMYEGGICYYVTENSLFCSGLRAEKCKSTLTISWWTKIYTSGLK